MTVQATASPIVASPVVARDAAVGLTVAAATFGVMEVLLQRIAAPVSAHVALPAARAVQPAGDFAAGATAALVVTASAALALALRRPVASGVLAAGLAATVLALAAPAARPVLYAVVAAGLVALLLPPGMWGEYRRARAPAPSDPAPPPPAHLPRIRGGGKRVALGAAAVAVAAGLWPLVFTAGVTEARTVAEAALVAAPVLAAVRVVQTRRAGAGAWLAAAAAGLVMAVALTVRLETTAMAAVWALGITLALPAVAYVLAAAAAGFVLAAWWADPSRRLRVAGAALLVVAGLQPAAVHHSLTALLALTLLSVPAGALRRETA